ncbi:hypothetical protein EON70_00610 [bacterium]|nr:MAG: hypothetical protein EON70_00610 [bacterium]
MLSNKEVRNKTELNKNFVKQKPSLNQNRVERTVPKQSFGSTSFWYKPSFGTVRHVRENFVRDNRTKLGPNVVQELKINQRRILIDSLEIGIPAPEQMIALGERQLPNGVKVGQLFNSKTLNYKKFTPHRDGLFCERIFGPVQSFVCACGKKKESVQSKSKQKEIVKKDVLTPILTLEGGEIPPTLQKSALFCPKCQVEYISKDVRRHRLGYIKLFAPVTHIWYLKSRPSYLSLFLGKRKKAIISLAYCNAFLVEQVYSDLELKATNVLKNANKSITDCIEKSHIKREQKFSLNDLAKNREKKSQAFLPNNSKIRGEEIKPTSSKHYNKSALYIPNWYQSNTNLTKQRHFSSCGDKPFFNLLVQLFPETSQHNYKLTNNDLAPITKPIFGKESQKVKQTSFYFSESNLKTFVPYQNKNRVEPKASLNQNEVLVRANVPKTSFWFNSVFGKPFITNSYKQRKLLFSPYIRAQTLPFLPSLICSFHLRDSLISFLQSSPCTEDVPIPFYCQTPRRYPLRDVHKFLTEFRSTGATNQAEKLTNESIVRLTGFPKKRKLSVMPSLKKRRTKTTKILRKLRLTGMEKESLASLRVGTVRTKTKFLFNEAFATPFSFYKKKVKQNGVKQKQKFYCLRYDKRELLNESFRSSSSFSFRSLPFALMNTFTKLKVTTFTVPGVNTFLRKDYTKFSQNIPFLHSFTNKNKENFSLLSSQAEKTLINTLPELCKYRYKSKLNFLDRNFYSKKSDFSFMQKQESLITRITLPLSFRYGSDNKKALIKNQVLLKAKPFFILPRDNKKLISLYLPTLLQVFHFDKNKIVPSKIESRGTRVKENQILFGGSKALHKQKVYVVQNRLPSLPVKLALQSTQGILLNFLQKQEKKCNGYYGETRINFRLNEKDSYKKFFNNNLLDLLLKKKIYTYQARLLYMVFGTINQNIDLQNKSSQTTSDSLLKWLKKPFFLDNRYISSHKTVILKKSIGTFKERQKKLYKNHVNTIDILDPIKVPKAKLLNTLPLAYTSKLYLNKDQDISQYRNIFFQLYTVSFKESQKKKYVDANKNKVFVTQTKFNEVSLNKNFVSSGLASLQVLSRQSDSQGDIIFKNLGKRLTPLVQQNDTTLIDRSQFSFLPKRSFGNLQDIKSSNILTICFWINCTFFISGSNRNTILFITKKSKKVQWKKGQTHFDLIESSVIQTDESLNKTIQKKTLAKQEQALVTTEFFQGVPDQLCNATVPPNQTNYIKASTNFISNSLPDSTVLSCILVKNLRISEQRVFNDSNSNKKLFHRVPTKLYKVYVNNTEINESDKQVKDQIFFTEYFKKKDIVAQKQVSLGAKKNSVFIKGKLLQTKTKSLFATQDQPLKKIWFSQRYTNLLGTHSNKLFLRSSMRAEKAFKQKLDQVKVFTNTDQVLSKNSQTSFGSDMISKWHINGAKEILLYTGGGALESLLKRFNIFLFYEFLFSEIQILRKHYKDQLFLIADYKNNRTLERKSFDFFDTNKGSIFNASLPRHNLIKAARKAEVLNLYNLGRKQNSFIPGSDLHDDKHYLELKYKEKANLQQNQVLFKQNLVEPLLVTEKSANLFCRRIYRITRRLKIVQLLMRSQRRPEWMMISVLPVLPPDLRPVLQMGENLIVASDLNTLYQRVIYRNNRHYKGRFLDFHFVSSIHRLVQDAVDRLIENGKGGSAPFLTPGGRPLKSLSDILKGKRGRFRFNLLGKRVDFSGRSVIVVSPNLKIHECGLPREMALELYKYFLIRQLLLKNKVSSIVNAKKVIKQRKSFIWDILREIIYYHPLLLNRAPTLHRLGIQAFQPKLTLGNAILLHPLVCAGFNADFDGDQMGVHLPLSPQARAEAWDLLWSRNNLLSPATGQPILLPSQDMVLGFYYMTALLPFGTTFTPLSQDHLEVTKTKFSRTKTKTLFKKSYTNNTKSLFASDGVKKQTDLPITYIFSDTFQVVHAYQKNQIDIHTPIWLKWVEKSENGEKNQVPLELRLDTFGYQTQIYPTYKSKNRVCKEIKSSFLPSHKKQTLTIHIRTTVGRVIVNNLLNKDQFSAKM